MFNFISVCHMYNNNLTEENIKTWKHVYNECHCMSKRFLRLQKMQIIHFSLTMQVLEWGRQSSVFPLSLNKLGSLPSLFKLTCQWIRVRHQDVTASDFSSIYFQMWVLGAQASAPFCIQWLLCLFFGQIRVLSFCWVFFMPTVLININFNCEEHWKQ